MIHEPRVKAVFDEALEIAVPAERLAFLDRACADAPEVRRQVEALLRAHAEAGSFLEQPAADLGVTVDARPNPGSIKNEAETLPPPGHVADSATLPPSGSSSTVAMTAQTSVPGFEILSELGRGGMGVVYKARQTKLNRIVALKMILAGGHAGTAQLERFRTEAEAIARLQHPNIVQIHEVGEHDGLPFFALEFCSGGSLEKKLAGTPLPAQEAAALVETLARAMHAVHEKAVIHRDLKPANVLLADDGTPKITDFGLAKRLASPGCEAGENLTATGAIMGTPSYMAPEQAEGGAKELRPACDIYALGAILYECLTGRPPFRAAALETLMQVVADEPAPPSQLNPQTPRDLETICLKCLAKEPGKRYATARVLAEDLRRFHAGEPIQARPVGRIEKSVKWVKRNPVVAALIAISLILLLGGAGGIYWKYAEAETALGERNIALGKTLDALGDRDTALAKEQKERERANNREKEAKLQLANSTVLLAQAAYQNSDVALAHERLDAVPVEHRHWEWYYLRRLFEGGLFTLYGHAGEISAVAWSPDGTRLATLGSDALRFWDARTGEHLWEIKAPPEGFGNSLAFSPDGMRLAVANVNKTATVSDLNLRQPLFDLKGHSELISSIAYSADGMRLVTGSIDKTVRQWDARTGKPQFEFKGHTNQVNTVAFSPDGTRVLSGGEDSPRLWEAESGKSVLEFQNGNVSQVAFSPDGTRLLVGYHSVSTRLWHIASGQQLLELNDSGSQSVAFSPDGTRLLTAGQEKVAKLWDARTGKLLLELKGHTNAVTSAAFSPDGARLLTGSYDTTAKVWDARTGQPLHLKAKVPGFHSVTAFSRDGKRMLVGHAPDKLALWDLETSNRLLEANAHTDTILSVAISPDGSRLLSGSADKTAKLWDAQTGALLLELKGHTNNVSCVAFSPDGGRLLTGSWDKTAKLWDAKTGQPLLVFDDAEPLHTVAFSPDGKRLFTGTSGAKLWDAIAGTLLHELKGNNGVEHAAFSADGKRLATAGNFGIAKMWDADTGQLLLDLRGHTSSITAVAFSPGGNRLITGSLDKTAKVWDTHTGQPVLDLAHSAYPLHAAFNLDGTGVFTCDGFGTARLWDSAPTGLGPGFNLPQGRGSLTFSLDGKRLLYDVDGKQTIHEAATGKALPDDPQFAMAPPSRYSPDGKSFVQGDGNALRLIDLRVLGREKPQRILWTQADPEWHGVELSRAFGTKDAFAALFHLERSYVLDPGRWNPGFLATRQQILTEMLQKDPGDRLSANLLARNSVASGVKSAALKEDHLKLLSRRWQGGMLLHENKPAEAIKTLEKALADRALEGPPIEELLLALAHWELKKPKEAKGWLAKAADWLDRYEQPMRIANSWAAAPHGFFGELVALAQKPSDPRHHSFDWENWHDAKILYERARKRLPQPGLIAHYRFRDHGKDLLGRSADFDLKNTSFKDDALYLNGVYEFDKVPGFRAKGVTPRLDYQAFTVLIRFRPSSFIAGLESSPILMGGTGRWFGINRNKTGALSITFNEHQSRYDIKNAKLEVDKDTEVACSVDVENRKLVVYVNGDKMDDLALPEDFTLKIAQAQWAETDKIWTFANYGNGTAFHGFVEELIVANGVFTPKQLRAAAMPQMKTKK